MECSIDGCESLVRSRGWCAKHYQRWRRHGDPLGRNTQPADCSVDGCSGRIVARGWCRPHYYRWRRHGDPLLGKLLGQTDMERFVSHADRAGDEECWPWSGSRLPEGYGLFWDGTRRNDERKSPRIVRTHRWIYEQHHGKIPAGLKICHTCDNPPCVNPAHLFMGTQADNMRDMISKGRADNRGERNGRSKLTREIVREIRRISTGKHGEATEFARMYGVTTATISKIILGRTWPE